MKKIIVSCLAIVMMLSVLAFAGCGKEEIDMSPQFKEQTLFVLNAESVGILGGASANGVYTFEADGTYTEVFYMAGSKVDAFDAAGTYELVKSEDGTITTIITTNSDTEETVEHAITKNADGKYQFVHAGAAAVGEVIYYVMGVELKLPSAPAAE